jgi:hypothetical protein
MTRTALGQTDDRHGPLPPLPTRLDDPVTGIVHGLFAGRTVADPLAFGPRSGRARRWRYVAAGGRDAAVGAAVVHLGALAVAFAWAQLGTRTVTWERRAPFGRGVEVDRGLDGSASVRLAGARLQLDVDGGLRVDVPAADGQRLTALVHPTGDATPTVGVTGTREGGWNATQKAAGYPVEGWVRRGSGPRVELGADGGGWRDASSGRQDRRTAWHWAAGAERAGDGRRVGLNASTGWKDEPWEDVVWWDGEPHRLEVARLRPQDAWEPTGDWVVGGPGWELWFEPDGVRAKDERLGVVTSRYVQPIGRFRGTLPSPEGRAVEVDLLGVTEDHLAVW